MRSSTVVHQDSPVRHEGLDPAASRGRASFMDVLSVFRDYATFDRSSIAFADVV